MKRLRRKRMVDPARNEFVREPSWHAADSFRCTTLHSLTPVPLLQGDIIEASTPSSRSSASESSVPQTPTSEHKVTSWGDVTPEPTVTAEQFKLRTSSKWAASLPSACHSMSRVHQSIATSSSRTRASSCWTQALSTRSTCGRSRQKRPLRTCAVRLLPEREGPQRPPQPEVPHRAGMDHDVPHRRVLNRNGRGGGGGGGGGSGGCQGALVAVTSLLRREGSS